MRQALESRNRILVVDDEDELVGALRLRLRCAGFMVLSASDGPTALSLVERENPHLIVLDVGLPGQDGYMVAQQLKSNPETARIPIIFFTGRATKQDADRGWELGAAGFLSKIAAPGRLAGSDALLKTVAATLDAWRD